MALMTFTGYLAEGELLMEYAGEVIRRPVADNRERQYASQELGLYFFAVDRDHCIDATHQGNIARYINHSCRCCHNPLLFQTVALYNCAAPGILSA